MTVTAARPQAHLRGLQLDGRLAPALVVVAIAVVLSAFHGGYPTQNWSPVALFVLALLALALVLAPPARSERSQLVFAALSLYGLFCAWSYLSIAWAEVPGEAWESANRSLFYGLVLAVVGLRPWSRVEAKLALGVISFGVTAVAVGVLVISAAGDIAPLFIGGRLASPTGYANATANLWLIAFWPALHLAASRGTAWPLRSASLAAASVLLNVALLSQSRGAVIAFGLAAVLYVAIVPRRWPALLALVTLVGLAALGSGTLLDVRDSDTVAELAARLADARAVIAVLAGVAAILAAIATLAASRMSPVLSRPGAERAGNYALMGLGALALVAGAIAIGDPVDWADGRWEDFRESGYEGLAGDETRFGGSLGSNRYDFYRVALDEFSEHPLVGIGAGNFQAAYLVERRSGEAPRYPHSLAFAVLAGLGAVGAVLLGGFLVLMSIAAAKARRRTSPEGAGLVAAALAGFAVWLFHGMADWLWEFGALSALALALLAIAARLTRPESTEPTSDDPRAAWEPAATVQRAEPLSLPHRSSWGRRALFGGATLALALSLALPGIAARYVDAAYESYPEGATRSLERLERAGELNFLSADPLLARGVIARRLERTREARRALERAIDREPENWFAHLELGLLEAGRGRRQAALASLATAERLNPRQPLVAEVRASVRRGQDVNATAVERRIYGQIQEKLEPTD